MEFIANRVLSEDILGRPSLSRTGDVAYITYKSVPFLIFITTNTHFIHSYTPRNEFHDLWPTVGYGQVDYAELDFIVEHMNNVTLHIKDTEALKVKIIKEWN